MSARPSGSLALLATLCLAATAGAAIPGDVDQNCVVEAADTLLLSRAVMGQITLNPEQQKAADVAPIVGGVSVPDGSITVADLVVLLRAVAGLQSLPDGVNVPTLDTLPSVTTAGYVDVAGTACAGDLVKLQVNGRLRGTAIAGANGRFSFALIGMAYDDNKFKATAAAGGQTSGDSTEQTVDNNQQPILPNAPVLTGAITVWPPPPPPEGAYTVSSDFQVPAANTLILPPGTIVKFQPSSSFEVDGRLLVQGATGAPVTLTKLNATDGRWDGILIRAGHETLIQSAHIFGAYYPISVTGANTSVTLRGSELYDFLQGITASAGASMVVAGSWIHYGSTTGVGIGITNANLTVTDSDLQNLASGINVSGSSFATIGPGNEFKTFHDAAIRIDGPADGLIIGNEIDVSATTTPPLAPRAQWGINLINSSPEIRANNIHGAETGIRVAGSSSPLITDGNKIYGNIWGIWLEGRGADSVAQPLTGNPNPVITGNSIYGNSGDRPPPPPPSNTRDYCSLVGANLCISDYPSGSNVSIDARGNYWGTDVATAIRASIIDPDVSLFTYNNNSFLYNTASDPVAIDLSNFAESATSGPGTTPLFLNAMTGISHSPSLMAPTFGDTLTIQFTLATPADVTLQIYAQSDCSAAPCDHVLREISVPGLGAGSHSILWDGKGNAGNFVPDEAYVYVLTTQVATFTDVFNPAAAPLGSKVVHTQLSNGSQSFPNTYNLYRNEPLKILFDVVNAGGRVRVNRVPDTGPTVTLAYFVAYPEFYRQLFVYDGFGPTGAFIGAGPATYWFHPEALQRNAVIVERTAPLIAGPAYQSVRGPTAGGGAVPAIEVKGDPYFVRLSYDQVSRIAFCIDQAAYLTVKVLKPGKGDPDVPADVVATLLQDTATPHGALNCVSGASPYIVEWDGTEPGAVDPAVLKPVADGSYTFTIEARNALQTNLRSIYRGIVQTRQ